MISTSNPDTKSCIVTLIDYGKVVKVLMSDLVLTSERIPVADQRDVHMKDGLFPVKKPFENGDIVLTKWRMDNTWYRGKLDTLGDEGESAIRFIDHDTLDIVLTRDMVYNCIDIPAKSKVDTNVCDVTVLQTVLRSAKPHMHSVGDKVIAKWDQDDTWYRASILKQDNSGSYVVLFDDYGNTAPVEPNQIVLDVRSLIPAELVDEFALISQETIDKSVKDISEREVKEQKASKTVDLEEAISVDDDVFAKWDYDSVWYRAVVTEIDQVSCTVRFYRYFNVATLQLKDILKRRGDIPEGGLLDKFIDQTDELKKSNVNNNDNSQSTDLGKSVKQPKNVKKVSNTNEGQLEIGIGSRIIAKWSEDEIWYRAQITGINAKSYDVLFIDYGNSDEVNKNKIVAKTKEIPQTDDVDEHVFAASQAEEVKTKNHLIAMVTLINFLVASKLCTRPILIVNHIATHNIEFYYENICEEK